MVWVCKTRSWRGIGEFAVWGLLLWLHDEAWVFTKMEGSTGGGGTMASVMPRSTVTLQRAGKLVFCQSDKIPSLLLFALTAATVSSSN